MSDKKIIYYLNQFFGQIGGEDKADMPPVYKEGAIGPADAFDKLLNEEAKVVGTIICGDNYFNENREDSIEFLRKINEEIKPDLVVAGPAFNAGRYGMACQGVAEFFNKQGIEVVSGMYEENPGLDEGRKIAYVVKTSDSAAQMRKALPKMANVSLKLLRKDVCKPDVDEYFSQGKRLTVFSEKTGSVRAVELLMKRLRNEDFETELPMPVFDTVDPANSIKDLSKATIALVTTGGIVPNGNPDRIQSASAQKWGKYNISSLDTLVGEYCTIHGGYDPVYANQNPDRVVPLDAFREFEKEGKIGRVYDWFYTTTGTGTAIGNSIKFGSEIGAELKEAGVDGVILTST